MFDVKKKNHNGITTYEREIWSANALKVEAGTNGLKGGDSGHGSRTYFSIEDIASTDIVIESTETGFEVSLGGDCELETIIRALNFIIYVLEEQKCGFGNTDE